VTEASEAQVRFDAPSLEFVQHAIRELGFEERFTVTKMSGGIGNTRVEVYSFPQLVNVLFGTKWDRLAPEGSKATLAWVDTDSLCRWLHDVVGDTELADAVRASLEGADYFKAQVDAMLPLFRERVAQYRTVLDDVADAAPAAP